MKRGGVFVNPNRNMGCRGGMQMNNCRQNTHMNGPAFREPKGALREDRSRVREERPCSGQIRECVFEFSESMPPAMSYTPFQIMCNLYQPCKALMAGTIFPELDKPWLAGGECPR